MTFLKTINPNGGKLYTIIQKLKILHQSVKITSFLKTK